MNASRSLKRGDRFVWRGQVKPPVYIEIVRVARDGAWADIRCCNWAAMWTKRQPLPLPAGTTAYAWTEFDLIRDADEAADEALTRLEAHA